MRELVEARLPGTVWQGKGSRNPEAARAGWVDGADGGAVAEALGEQVAGVHSWELDWA